MIFDKGAKTIQWRKDSLFNQWHYENWISTCKKLEWDLYLTPYMKINSKWVKDQNARPKTIKLSEENVGQMLHNIGFGNHFWEMTPKAEMIREKNRQIEIYKNLMHQNTIHRVKRQPTEWKKIFANHIIRKEINTQNTQRTSKTQ